MTLTEVNYYAKQFLPIGVIGGLTLLIFIFGFRLFMLYLEMQSTPPPPPVNTTPAYSNPIFGKIKAPEIPSARSPSSYTWILDTLDGTPNVENATSSAQIYFVPQKTASFGFLSTIYAMGKAVGIDTEIIEHTLEDKIASFDDGKNKISIDIRSFNFSQSYTISSEDVLTELTDDTMQGTLESQASAFLSKVGRYPTELAQGKRNVIYMRFDPGSKQVATLDSPVGANMAEVDFFPNDIDGRPVVTSSYYNSPHYVLLLIGAGRENKVARSAVSYHERSADQIAYYPLRSAYEAFADLQAGKGYVVSSSSDTGEVKIQRVFMAYYEPELYQEYVQPVYVFLGEGRFVAYVPAVAQDYLLE